MPIYEFVCGKCGHQFEELVRSAGTAEVRCVNCGSKEVDKTLSVFAARADHAPSPAAVGPCARCGDPDGPCRM